jgi:raffinose/stachyose/melibiose transport system permease protein
MAKAKNTTSNVIKSIVLILVGLTCVYPIYWMICLSFKTETESSAFPFSLPQHLMDVGFSNYDFVLKNVELIRGFKNSFIYTLGVLIIATVICTMGAYAISRMRSKLSKPIYTYYVVGLAVPGMVLMVPTYMITKFLGMVGTHWAVVIPCTGGVVSGSILLMVAFMKSLPFELEEAAAIDGCNVYNSFVKIMFPMVKPAVATRAMLIFLWMWNEFGWSKILAIKDYLRPITIEIAGFFRSTYVTNWGQVGAAVVMTSAPSVIAYCIGNKNIEQALTAGAILK